MDRTNACPRTGICSLVSHRPAACRTCRAARAAVAARAVACSDSGVTGSVTGSVAGAVVAGVVFTAVMTPIMPTTRAGTVAYGADHTHAGFRHTQPSGVSAGRVRAPHVGQAVGAPSLISWVASAESWGDPRRGRRPGTLWSAVMVSPLRFAGCETPRVIDSGFGH